MKKVFIIAILTAIFCSCQTSAQKKDWAQFGRYAHANFVDREKPAEQRRVIFFGNSITDFWPDTHPDFFKANGFIGRGISGQTSYQFLSRFREDAIEMHPQIIVLNVATNDIAENTHPFDEERTMGNIKSMVEIARANNIKVILTSVLPCSGFYWDKSITDVPAKIRSLNSKIKDYALENGLTYVDYFSALVDGDGVSLSPKYTKDGVHPTSEGYEVMERTILPAIREAGIE